MTDQFDYNPLTLGDLRRFLKDNPSLPDDALVGEPPSNITNDREFIPFDSISVIKVKRVEPRKDFTWVRYFTSTDKLARIPALALRPR